MQIVGEQIRLARLRRNLSVAQITDRATCSPLTVSRIEKGAPTVAIGIYLRCFRHCKIYCVNGNTGFNLESRIFLFYIFSLIINSLEL